MQNIYQFFYETHVGLLPNRLFLHPPPPLLQALSQAGWRLDRYSIGGGGQRGRRSQGLKDRRRKWRQRALFKLRRRMRDIPAPVLRGREPGGGGGGQGGEGPNAARPAILTRIRFFLNVFVSYCSLALLVNF